MTLDGKNRLWLSHNHGDDDPVRVPAKHTDTTSKLRKLIESPLSQEYPIVKLNEIAQIVYEELMNA